MSNVWQSGRLGEDMADFNLEKYILMNLQTPSENDAWLRL